ncbi:MAG: Asp23/Gls24 family envelope stress response protein [Candidatus Omnitrophota bacterium]
MIDREKKTDLGIIKINNDVVATLARIAACEVDGVVKVVGNFTDTVIEFITRKQVIRGIKVEISESEVKISMSIIVKYGTNLAEAAVKVQEKIKDAIENSIGLSVVEVDVNIQDLQP